MTVTRDEIKTLIEFCVAARERRECANSGEYYADAVGAEAIACKLPALLDELAIAVADSEESCLIANYNLEALLDERKRADAADAAVAELGRKRDELAAMIDALRSELDAMTQKHDWVLTNYDATENMCKKTLARVESADRELAAMGKDCDELDKTIEALEAKLSSLAPHGSCGCSVDTPYDICFHHSPQLTAALARAEAAERELAEMQTKLEAPARDAFPGADWEQEAKNIIASAKDGDALINSIRSALFWTFRAGVDVGEDEGKRTAVEEAIRIIERAPELASGKTIAAAIRALGEVEKTEASDARTP